MIDKALVKTRFAKSLDTYDENALIQKIMASKLVSLLEKKEFVSVLEVGCATGVLTREIVGNINFECFSANDIVEKSSDYIATIIDDCEFISGDIEVVDINKTYDLIISNACLQWCNNLTQTIDKLYSLLNDDGMLAFSVFGEENLFEINDLFKIENKFYPITELKTYLKKYNFIEYREEKSRLYFDNAIDVLKHLKYTGVNALSPFNLTKSKIKKFEEDYKRKYADNQKVYLTYNPVFVVIKKSK